MDDYSTEPRLNFSHLPHSLYCEYYALEMVGYKDDTEYYCSQVKPEHSVLELGCGEGRVTRALNNHGCKATGLDISPEMLSIAKKLSSPSVSYICEDMRKMKFNNQFDAIVIPHNTLNLLLDKKSIQRALSKCIVNLKEDGALHAQIFTPTSTLINQPEDTKTFQFLSLNDNSGGNVIKETLKTYKNSTKSVEIEERFRVRPKEGPSTFQDLSHHYKICAYDFETWKQLLEQCGFEIYQYYSGFSKDEYLAGEHSQLLFSAKKRKQ